MKRLLSSSKFQACLAGIISCVLVVFLGANEEDADQYIALLLKLITGLAGVYAITAAAEDVASKIGGGGGGSPTVTRSTTGASIDRPADFTRSVPKIITAMILASGLLVGNVACSTFDPGGQTAKAMNQRSQFVWDENGRFNTDIDGTQTGEFVMAEGNVALKEDGTLDQEGSTLTYYLAYKPKADATRDAFAMAYQQSSLQMQMQLNTINQLMSIIGARMGVQVGGDGAYIPPVVQPAGPSTADRLLGLLEERLQAPAVTSKTTKSK